MRPDSLGERPDLTAEHGLGLPRLPLRLELADARDDAQAGVEGVRGAARDRLVRLAEVLPTLRVPDDRPVDADLAAASPRETSPVNAPVSSQWTFCAKTAIARDPASAARAPRRATRTAGRRRRRIAVEAGRAGRERRAELAGLGRPLEHLPVARDEHQPDGIAATPGSSRPSSSSSDAPPPVETQSILSARPSSSIARTESPPPTTV